MITFLEGILVEKSPTRAVINIGGVGYEVMIPLSSFDRLGPQQQNCRLLIFDYVREDQHALFGFISEAERKMFSLLMNVSGIGPRLALSALSSLSVREMISAIAAGDTKRLSSISGVGRKLAERMVLELRDKISDSQAFEALAPAVSVSAADHHLRDAVLALISLGYKQADAQKMANAAIAEGESNIGVEEIVRKALTR